MEGTTTVTEPKNISPEDAAKAAAAQAEADAKAAADKAAAEAAAAPKPPATKVADVVPDAKPNEPAWTKERTERAERRGREKLAAQAGFKTVEEMESYLAKKAEDEEAKKTEAQRTADRIAKAEADAKAARDEAAAAARRLETERAELKRTALEDRLKIVAASVGISDPDRQKVAIEKFTARCKELSLKDPNAEIDERAFFAVELKAKAGWLYDAPAAPPPAPKVPEVPANTAPQGEAPKPVPPNTPTQKSVAEMTDAEFRDYTRRQGIDAS